ncbi:hypothetical protein [Pedobacter sp.]|uniref:hypothetical protein n=1 Tax=Pedobacter sp. TaxID=1411316 RepID=UPI003BA9B1B2
MKVGLFIGFLLFLFSSLESRAQTGCLVPGGDVYTSAEGSLVNVILGVLVGPGYKGSPTPSASSCIANSMTVYVPNNTQNCRVCTGGGFTIVIPGVVVTCGTTLIDGKIATATVVQCDLDDHSWVLGLAAGALGLIIIRRKKLL